MTATRRRKTGATTDRADGADEKLRPGDTWTHPETGAKYKVVAGGDCEDCAFYHDKHCPCVSPKVLAWEEIPKCHPDVAGGEGWHFETARVARRIRRR